MEQVTRGHNTVADGWAGECNPHPHSHPPHTNSHAQTIATAVIIMRIFTLYNSLIMERWTDGRTNRPTKVKVYVTKKNKK